MLETKENQSGHTVTVTFKGTQGEVTSAIGKFINQYANGGYAGVLVSFGHGDYAKFQGGVYTAVCERDSNCD